MSAKLITNDTLLGMAKNNDPNFLMNIMICFPKLISMPQKYNHSYSRAYQAHIHYVGQRNHRKD